MNPLHQAAENVIKVACAEHVTYDRICRIAQQAKITPDEATPEVLAALCRGYQGLFFVDGDALVGDWDLIGRITVGQIRMLGAQPERPLIYSPSGDLIK